MKYIETLLDICDGEVECDLVVEWPSCGGEGGGTSEIVSEMLNGMSGICIEWMTSYSSGSYFCCLEEQLPSVTVQMKGRFTKIWRVLGQ